MKAQNTKNMNQFKIFSIVIIFILGFAACELIDDDENGSPYSKDQYEPNDTRGEAAEIAIATDVNATIYPVDDVDFYRVTTSNVGVWDRVEFALTNVSEDLRLRLIITDEDGVQLATGYAANRGANLSFNIETLGGTYYARVESFHAGNVGSYTLTVRNLDNNDQYAPNDTRDDAHDLGVLPAENIQGVIATQDEEDWFKITTENDGIWDYVEFELANVSSDLRAQMYIYNEAGTQLGSPYAGSGGQGLRYTLATTGGVYYIRLKRFTGTLEEGAYTLNVRNLHANDSYAPNQTREDAYNLGSLPIDIEGTIIMAEGEDWFQFTAVNDNPIVVNLTNVGEELRPRIRLHDGTTYSQFTTGSKGSSILNYEFTGVGSPSQAIEAGKTYYFMVSSFYTNGYGDYSLSISQ